MHKPTIFTDFWLSWNPWQVSQVIKTPHVFTSAKTDFFVWFLESYVRQDVIDLIPKLAVVCEEVDQKTNIVDRHFLPIVLESLTDSDVKVTHTTV